MLHVLQEVSKSGRSFWSLALRLDYKTTSHFCMQHYYVISGAAQQEHGIERGTAREGEE